MTRANSVIYCRGLRVWVNRANPGIYPEPTAVVALGMREACLSVPPVFLKENVGTF